ncbi:MAG: hypothetical protein EBY61_09740, partial [Actinobacteria bacterium]|nr:hypothetical protein [Actinomycetota bacterium]
RSLQCGRRVDALKAWLTWKSRGDIGMAARVDHAMALADHARRRVAERDDMAFIVAGDFTNVCLTWVPPELRPFDLASLEPAQHAALHAVAPAAKAAMQAEGSALIGYQPVHGVNCFRLIFMNPAVTHDDVDILLDLIGRYRRRSPAVSRSGATRSPGRVHRAVDRPDGGVASCRTGSDGGGHQCAIPHPVSPLRRRYLCQPDDHGACVGRRASKESRARRLRPRRVAPFDPALRHRPVFHRRGHSSSGRRPGRWHSGRPHRHELRLPDEEGHPPRWRCCAPLEA